MVILLVISIELNAQRRRVELNQADPRFTIWVESYFSFQTESIYYYIRNNTNDKYSLVVDVTVTSSCFGSETYKLGVNDIITLLPGGLFTPKTDDVHNFVGFEKHNNCRIKVGDTYTYVSDISYKYSDIRNITKEDLDKQRAKLEAEKIKEKESLEKKESITNTPNEDQVVKSNTTASEQQNVADKSPAKSDITQTNSDTQSEEAKVAEEDLKQKIAEDRIAAAKKKAEEEAEENRLRQINYDNWKAQAQSDRSVQDGLAIGTTTSLLFMIGGFIYDGMGSLEPELVYRPPINKFKPSFFINNSFGYSGSMEPMLFKSDYTTMQDGSYVTTEENTNVTGYFVNLGWQSNIGVGNDYYNAYGTIATKIGIIPTFSGFQFNLGIGAGIDVGIKNIKFYMSFKQNIADIKTMTSLDVEENGEASYSMPSGEFGYGLKFTLGGEKEDNYVRHHIYLGLLSKSYNFTSDSYQSYYDPITDTFSSFGKPRINGFNFEWRKDHNFSLFLRVYEDHIFVGDSYYGSTTSSYPYDSYSSTYLLIGFTRALDYFFH